MQSVLGDLSGVFQGTRSEIIENYIFASVRVGENIVSSCDLSVSVQ